MFWMMLLGISWNNFWLMKKKNRIIKEVLMVNIFFGDDFVINMVVENGVWNY